MCSEIDHFPSFLSRTMSDDRQILPAAADSLPESETAAAETETKNLEDGGDHREIKNDDAAKEEEKEEEEDDKATASRVEVDDGDDGFKTPTSSAHRIPAITECPPPPVKPRPPPPRLKRKASSPQQTTEVESVFRHVDGDSHSIKKSRTDDGEGRS